jgi:hypothetical protein
VSATLDTNKAAKGDRKNKGRWSFDYTNFNKEVERAGTAKAFEIINAFMDGQEIVDLVTSHPAIKVAPKRKRKAVRSNDMDALRWFVQSLINTLVGTCGDSEIKMISRHSSDDAWKAVVSKLHACFSEAKPVSVTTNGATEATTKPSASRFSEERRRQRQEQRGSSRSTRRRHTKSAGR